MISEGDKKFWIYSHFNFLLRRFWEKAKRFLMVQIEAELHDCPIKCPLDAIMPRPKRLYSNNVSGKRCAFFFAF